MAYDKPSQHFYFKLHIDNIGQNFLIIWYFTLKRFQEFTTFTGKKYFSFVFEFVLISLLKYFKNSLNHIYTLVKNFQGSKISISTAISINCYVEIYFGELMSLFIYYIEFL